MERMFPRCGKKGHFFPHNGKSFGDFSTQWKKCFHGVEKKGDFFHTMENVFAVFPHNGKNVSTVRKTIIVATIIVWGWRGSR
jgi:hypothetical protein